MSMTVEMILRLVDQATGPIRGVENELTKLQKTAEAVSKPAGRMRFSEWAEQQQAIKKAREEAERYEQTMRKVNAAQSAAMAAAAAHGIERVSTAMWRAGVREGVAGEHSQVSLETQGNSVTDITKIQDEAAQLSHRFKAFSQTQFETMIGAAKSYTGSLEHAYEAMDDLAKMRMIQLGQHGHSSDEAFNTVTKSLETAGVAGDPKRLHDRLESYAKIMNVFKETLNESSFAAFFNEVGPAASSLSERFLRGTAAHLMQEMGAGQAGTAISQFQQEFQAGTATPKAMETLDKLGLLQEFGAHGERMVRRKTNNEIRWLDPHSIKGWKLALSDPDLWIEKYLAPALAQMPSDDDRLAAEMAMASNGNVRRLLNKVLHQRNVIEKDLAQVNAAPGLEAWKTWADKDPATAATGVQSQFDNLMRDAAKPYMPAATKFMNWFSELEGRLGGVAEKHPLTSAATGAGLIMTGWVAAAALARQALIKGGEAWGAGVARATAEGGAAAGGGLVKGLFRGGLTGLVLSALWDQRDAIGGAIRGTTAERHRAEVDAIHAAFNHRPGEAATSVFDRMRQLHYDAPLPPIPTFVQTRIEDEQRRGKNLGRSRFIGPEAPATAGFGAEIPTFAFLHGVPGGAEAEASSSAKPHVDTSEIDAARTKAQEAGEQIKQSLDVTAAPTVDASSIDAFLTKAREAASLLGQLDRMGAALRRSGGAHALHDGPEAH